MTIVQGKKNIVITKDSLENANAIAKQDKDADANKKAFVAAEEERPFKRARIDYEYKMLANLSSGVHHFYGVISDYKNAKSTKGAQSTITICLIDESLDSGQFFQLCLLSELQNLPTPSCVGQVLRVHRCKVQQYKAGNFQGNWGGGIDFLILDGTVDAPIPATTIANKTFTEHDRKRVGELRKWSQAVIGTERCSIGKYRKYLKQVGSASGDYADLICKVIKKEKVQNSLVVEIWDGTLLTDQTGTTKNTAKVIITNASMQFTFQSISDNAWVKFRGIRLFKGNLESNENSSVCVLPAYHYDVQNTLKYVLQFDKIYPSLDYSKQTARISKMKLQQHLPKAQLLQLPQLPVHPKMNHLFKV